MSYGFQKARVPSYASRLRDESAPYKQSRVENYGGNASRAPPSAFQNKNYMNANVPSQAGHHLPSTPSNLAPYSQAHTNKAKTIVADSRRPKKSYYDDDSAPIPQATGQANWIAPEVTTQASRDQQGIVNSMTKLSVNPAQNPDAVVMGRCMNWERPNPSTNSKVSKCNPRTDRSYGKPITSEYSISYKRTPHQVPMEQAGYREYAPFLRSEFKVGTIVRRNVHEPDYKGPAPPAFAPGSQASQTSTLVTTQGGIKGYREHRSNGDYGPVYSEDRYFIVVSLCKITYYAIPLYTHEKKGLANIAEKEDWISVQDHRKPDNCRQQSGHEPLCTKAMNPDAKILDPVTTAWLPYAIPIRYSVPVAYQGRLDPASAKRVRSLFLEYLGGEK